MKVRIYRDEIKPEDFSVHIPSHLEIIIEDRPIPATAPANTLPAPDYYRDHPSKPWIDGSDQVVIDYHLLGNLLSYTSGCEEGEVLTFLDNILSTRKMVAED